MPALGHCNVCGCSGCSTSIGPVLILIFCYPYSYPDGALRNPFRIGPAIVKAGPIYICVCVCVCVCVILICLLFNALIGSGELCSSSLVLFGI